MSKHPPSFDMFYREFVYGCRDMTREQIGAYVLLLIEQFVVDALPTDHERLRAICSTRFDPCNEQQFDDIWSVLAMKFDLSRDGLRNSKMRKVRERTYLRWKQNCENAKKGGRPRKTQRKTGRNSDRLTVSEVEVEVEGSISKKKTVFEKPTVDEVASFAAEKNLGHVNAEAFVDFYESKGWMVGKSPMKSWKAALRGWNSRNRQNATPKRSLNGENVAEALRMIQQREAQS